MQILNHGFCFLGNRKASHEPGLASGARRGELLALTWPDVDWLSRTVTINKSLEQTRAGLRLKGTKNDDMRICRLPQAAMVALQFLKEQQTQHSRLFGSDYRDQGLVFCKPNGDFLTPISFPKPSSEDCERRASKTQAFIPAGIPTLRTCSPRASLFQRFQSA
jgi:integrase